LYLLYFCRTTRGAGLPDPPPPALSILIERLQRLLSAAPIPELEDGAVSAQSRAAEARTNAQKLSSIAPDRLVR
jgi:hypothetical protein